MANFDIGEVDSVRVTALANTVSGMGTGTKITEAFGQALQSFYTPEMDSFSPAHLGEVVRETQINAQAPAQNAAQEYSYAESVRSAATLPKMPDSTTRGR